MPVEYFEYCPVVLISRWHLFQKELIIRVPAMYRFIPADWKTGLCLGVEINSAGWRLHACNDIIQVKVSLNLEHDFVSTSR